MSKRVVLIIGAGASNALHPKFGLGADLLQEISDRVTDRTSIHSPYLSNLLNNHYLEYSVRWQFVHYIDEYRQTSKNPSIDGFLDEISTYPEFNNVKDDFIKIGKFSIMFQILGYEGLIKNSTYENFGQHIWIDQIGKFIKGQKLLENNFSHEYDLKIITFNYDRNIEHFLYNQHRFANDKTKLIDFINSSIVHVYGKVGDLKWQSQDEFFEFGEDNSNSTKILNQKNTIGTIYSDKMNDENSEVIKARQWLHSADTYLVCTFGFNFDLMNYRLLALQNLGMSRECRLIANIYPYDDNQFKNRRIMANKIRSVKHEVELTYLSCNDFLKKIFFELA